MVQIAEREQELPEQMIGQLLRVAAESKGVISLGPGEPDFPLPKPLVEYTKKIAGKCNHYSPPGGIAELREALCKKLKKENKIKTSPENIVVTCGSQDALLIATACTLDCSEQVILPNPSYMAYLPTIELFDANPQFVELRERDAFEINPDLVEKAIDPKKTKVLIINSPANPTGNVLSKKVVEQLADIAIEHDLYIFSDEAYEKIIYDDAKHISIGSLNGMEENVVSFYTFSKTYAMCGHRLGYCVAPPSLADAMKKTHVYTTICAPTISQMLGIKALSLPSKYVDAMVREYDRRRRVIVSRLNELGLSTPVPKGAFYAFASIKQFGMPSRVFAQRLLKEAGVAVVPGSDFGKFGEGYIRCSYATKLPLIEKALDRIERFVAKLGKK